MDIAQKLSELMASRQMSRGALARALGVHTSTVTNWLSGKAVKSETLPAICDVFGCSIDYLLGSETKKEPTATNGSELTEEEVKFLEWFRSQASEKDKALVRMIVEGE